MSLDETTATNKRSAAKYPSPSTRGKTLLRDTQSGVTIGLDPFFFLRGSPMCKSRCLAGAMLAFSLTFAAEPAVAQLSSGSITFKRTQLDSIFRSEGVAVGDFNKDGKKDIAAGTVWYSAPDWKMHLTSDKAPEFDPHGYSNAFQAFADDINGDGWTDIIHVEWPGK